MANSIMQFNRSFGAILLIICMIAAPTLAQTKRIDWKRLPTKIAKRCHTPVEWVTISGEDEVHVQPSPDGDFSKVECVLAQLKKYDGIKLGFIGNEMDPNAVLTRPYSYIAEGTKTQIQTLSAAVKAEGWIVVRLANADDDTSFIKFQTRNGETGGGADKLMQRIWKKEFGDLAIGNTPRRLSEPDDFDQ